VKEGLLLGPKLNGIHINDIRMTAPTDRHPVVRAGRESTGCDHGRQQGNGSKHLTWVDNLTNYDCRLVRGWTYQDTRKALGRIQSV
jgi:hypothetical protein